MTMMRWKSDKTQAALGVYSDRDTMLPRIFWAALGAGIANRRCKASILIGFIFEPNRCHLMQTDCGATILDMRYSVPRRFSA